MQRAKLIPTNKRGGVISSLVSGVGGLIILVVITLVVISTLLTANLLKGTENDTAYSMSGNFSIGLANVAGKIPTILLIAAVVLLFGVLVLLVRQSKIMTGGAGGGSL